MEVGFVVEHYFVSVLATNYITFTKMKPLILFVCCAVVTASAKEKQISLEDIERDNLRVGSPISKSVQEKPQHLPPGSPTPYGFLPVKTAADYARQEPKQQYIQPQYIPQQEYLAQQYYYQQPYQQYENVQYITDNAISAQPQQYYAAPTQQQYIYLQQYTAPSTAIQTVVDPKGTIQYVMYLPAAYTGKEEGVQQQNAGIVYANEASTEYVQEQPAPAGVKYVESVESVVPVRKEPKSLLDSYVPSYLQIQYYKQQQQQQANAIQQSLKEISSAAAVKRPSQLKYNYIPSH